MFEYFWRGAVRLAVVLVCVVTAAPPSSVFGQILLLPSGWSLTHIGGGFSNGFATFLGGTFSLSGSGDVWGPADQFTFVHRALTGDATVVVRLATLLDLGQGSKAGVMIRESLTADAKYGFVYGSPNRGIVFQARKEEGASGNSISDVPGTAPVWLKLERQAAIVTGYASEDGVNWTEIGSASVSMAATVYVGLTVISQVGINPVTASFDRLTVQQGSAANGPPVVSNESPDVSLTAPAAGATYTAPAVITLGATASDTDGSVTRVDFYAGSTWIGMDTTSPYAASWLNVMPGAYSLTAVARDNAGGTTVSAARDITVRNLLTPTRAVFTPSSNHATAVERYELQIFMAGLNPEVSNPLATQNLGKPPIVNGECNVDVGVTVTALLPGSYIATVTAIGPGGSAQSAPAAFTR